jgi:hypothetical protein
VRNFYLKILFALLIIPQFAPGQTVFSGKVVDTRNLYPVPGAEVSLLGTNVKVITDNMGNFSLITGIEDTDHQDDYKLRTVNNTLFWYSDKMINIRIVNILGQNLNTGYNLIIGSGEISMINYADGIYLLNITCNGISKTFKVIKTGNSLNLSKNYSTTDPGHKRFRENDSESTDTLLIVKPGYFTQKYPFRNTDETYEILKSDYGDIDFLNRMTRPEAFMMLQGLPLNPSFGEVKSIKIVYSLSDNTVFYSNSEKYFIHYFFCRDVLGYNKGHQVFNQEQYSKNANRKYILASLNYFTSSGIFTLEFFAGDELDCADIEKVYIKVAETSWIGNKLRFYANATKWEVCSNVPPVSSDELYKGQNYQALNPGDNYGYLKKVTADELGTTYLGRHDIVLLNSIPLDISVVAGIITTDFQTPLSHINVLSHNRGTPNMALRDGWTNPKFDNLLNKLVYLKVTLDSFFIREATLEEAQVFWAQKEPQTPNILQLDTITNGLIDLNTAGISLVKTIGGKAANFAELTKINVTNYGPIPLPEGYFAIPFSYYWQHIKKYGLDIFIDAMLKDSVFNTDAGYRDLKLKILQDSIKKSPLDPGLIQLVTEHLSATGNFTDFRFRSSTNAEDIEGFNGAGLYESYTGSISNPDRPVDKAIKKVWASLWFYGAFEERDYFKIDHKTIAMGILVNRSFPAEAANGVAITENLYNRYNPAITINVQVGEISVVSPEEKYLPDQIICYTYSSEYIFEYLNHSNVPGMEGKTVMTDSELTTLKSYCMAIHYYYCILNSECKTMDIEFKVDIINGERKIYIKQARLY